MHIHIYKPRLFIGAKRHACFTILKNYFYYTKHITRKFIFLAFRVSVYFLEIYTFKKLLIVHRHNFKTPYFSVQKQPILCDSINFFKYTNIVVKDYKKKYLIQESRCLLDRHVIQETYQMTPVPNYQAHLFRPIDLWSWIFLQHKN